MENDKWRLAKLKSLTFERGDGLAATFASSTVDQGAVGGEGKSGALPGVDRARVWVAVGDPTGRDCWFQSAAVAAMEGWAKGGRQ